MFRSVGPRGVLGGTRPARLRPSICGLRVGRPVRHQCPGAGTFKDWFSGLVQQKEAQPEQPAQASPSLDNSASSVATAPPPLTTPVQKAAPKRDFLEARQVSLFQLFDSSDYKFDIPAYQRPYAWGTKQIYELLQDFVKAYQTRQEYFLGAIVATKAADGAHVPYQLIDGQQRLTSMVILLAFLHGWARDQGHEVLEGRIRRMLYLEADPLEPDSRGRYRLRLRDSDDSFFRSNVLDTFLPAHYRLAGVAAAAGADAALGAADAAEAASSLQGDDAAVPGAAAGSFSDALPLENETWWRLYENASFLRSQLSKLVAEGLNVQDFTFHVLRNCFVVMMVARDEGASFRIFASLNGRGMDLSVVDKLKADLLAGELSPAERLHYADAWAEMESVLGRAAFHRVFDYMRDLAAVRDPRVSEVSVLDYFTRRVDDPRAVKQVLQVSLDYARLLLQLRQASWTCPELAAMLAETPQEEEQLEDAEAAAARAAVVAAAVGALAHPVALAPEEEGRHLEALHAQLRQWQDGDVPAVEAGEDVLAPTFQAAAVDAETLTAVAEEIKLESQEEEEEVVNLQEQQQQPAAVVARGEEEEEKRDDVMVFRFDSTPEVPAAVAETVLAVELPPAVSEADASAGAESVVAFAATVAASQTVTAATEVEEEDKKQPLLPVEFPSALQDLGAAVVAAVAGAEAVDSTLARAEASTLGAAEETKPLAITSQEDATVTGAASTTEESAAVLLEQELRERALLAEADTADVATAEAASSSSSLLDASLEAPLGAVLDADQQAVVAAPAAPRASDSAELHQRRQAELLAELDTRSSHMNLFSDEAWLPPLLEFFYQTDSLAQRVAFMKGAESLQLLLELLADPAAKAARWGLVSEALLERPFSPEAVLKALQLNEAERGAFRARLDSKDLYGTTDQRTLRHLLIRSEPPSVVQQLSGVSGLIVEKIVPQSAPEGSLWRKTRITSQSDPQSAWPETYFAVTTAAAPPPGETPATSPAVTATHDVKYWYEVQRLNWHGKLGNLVLLPATTASAAAATAEYDVKAALWRQAGVQARLPAFTAPLVDNQGRYGRFKFCYEECRQRHEDMLERLIEVFEL